MAMHEVFLGILGLVALGFILYLVGEWNWRWEKRMARECIIPAPLIE